MKQLYTIKEISQLYGIGVDSIRYYETKGLIAPQRGDNNYRYYSLNDIFILNIIRDLLALDFSTEQIKDYLDAFSLSHTITLYETEKERVQTEISKLNEINESLNYRSDMLRFYRHLDTATITIKEYSIRYGYELESQMRSDEETDFVIKQLHRKHQEELDELGDLEIGAIPSYDDANQGILNTMQSVFFIGDEETDDYDFILPAGTYISIFYQGSYKQSVANLKKIINVAHEHGYTSDNRPFEIYRIDNRYTQNESEFLTEVQLKLNDKKGAVTQ
ncbi:MerR family transcriptional regulator [Erysipelothrix anatis]|uniref:MerR family transcriptional regulator n=1 Tax=Erysipelothrix anatis TaxID=2683713 RepID=UPI00135A2D21|nr:MerR family transcriptional regulator [Erysipelothrix anatis]